MREKQQSQVSAPTETTQPSANNVAVEFLGAMAPERTRRQPVTDTGWVDGKGNPVSAEVALDVLSA